MNNTMCVPCNKYWSEPRLKTLRGKEIHSRPIAYYGGPGWREIKCPICKRTAVRMKLDGKIKDHQLNKWSAQNKEYTNK